MRSRTEGMWWGPALEAPDPAALARFYSELVGWPVVHEEPGTTVLATARDGSVNVVFQQATGYRPPVWPPEGGQQRPMIRPRLLRAPSPAGPCPGCCARPRRRPGRARP